MPKALDNVYKVIVKDVFGTGPRWREDTSYLLLKNN